LRTDPLAYLTAQTNGLTDVAQEILDAAGLTEQDLEDVPTFSRSTLAPPKVITSTAQLNWPTIAAGENFFDKALVNGGLLPQEGAEPYMNGHDVGGATTNDWEGDGALADEDGGDAGWGLDEELPVADEQTNGVAEEDSGDAASATPGVSENELWVRNSPFAGDHIAAGSFETAMQVMLLSSILLSFPLIHSLCLFLVAQPTSRGCRVRAIKTVIPGCISFCPCLYISQSCSSAAAITYSP
jgi:coatomer subunit alpha